MINYQEMSDFEINKAVAIAIGYSPEMCEQGWEGSSKVGVEWENESGYPSRWFDYCNSWADAGPIIEKYRIELIPDSPDSSCHSNHKWWDAAFYSGGMKVCGVKNVISPLRAAMIVFLMMKGGE